MKKILYIGIAVFALGMVSCSKQDIQPNASADSAVPVWKSLDNGSSNPGPIGSGDGGITDPNEPNLDPTVTGN